MIWPPYPPAGSDAAYDRFTDDLATGPDPYATEWESPPRPCTVNPSEEDPRV